MTQTFERGQDFQEVESYLAGATKHEEDLSSEKQGPLAWKSIWEAHSEQPVQHHAKKKSRP